MEHAGIMSLLTQLDDEIDDLQEALSPLLKNVLSDSASKLPLLDKAKLYVLITYAIESVLFSYLRLNGVKARAHPVFQELTRVKQYFNKIKNIEYPTETKLKLDKAAAARFVKAGLAGNYEFDLDMAEKRAKDRVKHLRLDNPTDRLAKKHKTGTVEDMADADLDNSDSTSSRESFEGGGSAEHNKQQVGREVRSNVPQMAGFSNLPSRQIIGEWQGEMGTIVKSNNAEGEERTGTKWPDGRKMKLKRHLDDNESSQGKRKSESKRRAR